MSRPTLSVEFALGGNGPGAASYFILDNPDKGVLDRNWLAPSASPPAPSATWLTLDDPSRGRLDVGQLAGDALDAGFWVDVGDWCTSMSTRRGRRRLIEGFSTGTATITLRNDDRRFDPENLVGPYAAAGVSNLRTRVPCRISATYAGTRYPIFAGYVDKWDPRYNEPGTGVCVVTVSDAFKILGGIDPVEQSAQGAGELSGARINRILDNAGFPSADRAIDAGNSAMQATTLATNVLTELKLVAESERGQFYVDSSGQVAFRERHARFERSRSVNVQGIFGDAAGELDYSSISAPIDDELIVNQANIARSGGVSQSWGSDASRTQYLLSTYTRTNLTFTTDAEAAEYARWIIRQFADQDRRVEQVTIEPDGMDGGADPWPILLGAEIGDRYQVRRRPLNSTPIDADCWVEGVSHDIGAINAGGRWVTKFDFSDASRSNAFLLDHAELGQLDVNVLAY